MGRRVNPEVTSAVIAVLVTAVVQLGLAAMKKRNGKDGAQPPSHANSNLEAYVQALVKEFAEFKGRIDQQMESNEREMLRFRDELGRFRDRVHEVSNALHSVLARKDPS
jgi:hypothetical protein